MTIDKQLAWTIVEAVHAQGTARGLKPFSVAVVDSGGHLVAFGRADGGNPGGADIARNKAYGAVMMKLGGYRQRELSEETAWFLTSAREICGGRFFPVPGAVLVRDEAGLVVGGVGVTGDTPDNDAECAAAAIESVGLTAET